MMYGKLPPQAKDLEKAVLGAILLDIRAFDLVADIIIPESFYVEAHQLIFKSIRSLKNRNDQPDILSVVEELNRQGNLDLAGGPFYVTQITNAVVSTANIEQHARIIAQKYLSRELIRISGEIMNQAYDETNDVFDLMDDAEKQLNTLTLSHSKKAYNTLQYSLEKVLMKVEDLRHREEKITGVPTGITKLDFVTNGWQPQDLIILAARPSIGKSAVAGNLARLAAQDTDRPTGVGIFSLEMADEQWASRILSAESGIDGWRMKKGRISDSEMKHLNYTYSHKLKNLNIFLDDTSGLNIYELKAKARRLVMKEKVGLIIIDYLQLMSGNGEKQGNREQEISNISRNLKQLAKELNVPIIALSQLSRASEQNRAPKLSDLRESGAIEQDADTVIFLVPMDEESIKKDPTLKDSILMRIAKHRNGALEDVELKFVKDIQKIMSYSAYEDYMSQRKFTNKMNTGGLDQGEIKLTDPTAAGFRPLLPHKKDEEEGLPF